MSYFSVAKNLTGEVPNVSLALAQSKLVDALGKIYDQTDWSFQRSIVYGGWLVPGNVANTGTYTVTPYSNIVVADVTATQVLNSLVAPPFITQLQFRNPSYSIYNICGVKGSGNIAYITLVTSGSGQTPGTYTVPVTDAGIGGVGSGATVSITVNASGIVTETPVVLTAGQGYSFPVIVFSEGGTPATFLVSQNIALILDRAWTEPTSGPGQPYMIYQCYFVAPSSNFRKFIEIRDTTNSAPIDFWSMTEAELASRDPQRTEFADPSFVVPAGVDTRPGTSTPGWKMFELWPQQLDYIPYSFSYRIRGPIPQTQSDFLNTTVPDPLTEEMLKWRALEVLYQWKEAQEKEHRARGAGANWLLLAQMAKKEYDEIYMNVLQIDLNLNGEMITRIPGRGKPLSNRPYSNQLGGLNIGGYPESNY